MNSSSASHHVSDAVPVLDRAAAWQDAISTTFTALAPELPDPQRFVGRIATKKIAGLIVSQVAAGPQTVRRDRKSIERSSNGSLFLIRHNFGDCAVAGHKGEQILHRGDFVLVDPCSPYTLNFPESFRQTCIQIPYGWLQERLIVPSRVKVGQKLSCTNPMTRVLGAAITELQNVKLGSANQPELRDLFLDLLIRSLDFDGKGEANSPPSRSIMDGRVTGYIVRECRDETMSPTSVALALGCSVRYVHKSCANAGTTFGRILKDARLFEAASILDGLPAGPGRVTEAAFKAGFSDLSHFSRAFKERFGVSANAYALN